MSTYAQPAVATTVADADLASWPLPAEWVHDGTPDASGAVLSRSADSRARIHAAAASLGYTPNAFARGLKLRRTMTLGLVLPNVGSGVNLEIIQGAERRAAGAGYVVLIADADDFEATGDLHRRLLLE